MFRQIAFFPTRLRPSQQIFETHLANLFYQHARADPLKQRRHALHGNSGGPAVNAAGAVETTVFAARLSGGGGYGVPASIVRRALAAASGPVSTGRCA